MRWLSCRHVRSTAHVVLKGEGRNLDDTKGRKEGRSQGVSMTSWSQSVCQRRKDSVASACLCPSSQFTLTTRLIHLALEPSLLCLLLSSDFTTASPCSFSPASQDVDLSPPPFDA
jgi:hypothetical protein